MSEHVFSHVSEGRFYRSHKDKLKYFKREAWKQIDFIVVMGADPLQLDKKKKFNMIRAFL